MSPQMSKPPICHKFINLSFKSIEVLGDISSKGKQATELFCCTERKRSSPA